MFALVTFRRTCVYFPPGTNATPRTSVALFLSFFMSHVRDVDETVFHSPVSPLFALTSENVTSSALASLNGLSVRSTDSWAVALDVPPPVGAELLDVVLGVTGVVPPEH